MSDADHGASAAAVDAMDMLGTDPQPDTELHLQLSPVRAATADDSTRADMLLIDMRDALRKYGDVRVAAADGGGSHPGGLAFASHCPGKAPPDVERAPLGNQLALANAPTPGNGYFKVPRVIER